MTFRSLIISFILKSINYTLFQLLRKVTQTLSNNLIRIKFTLLNNVK
nr:MAG TPA: hypothetical protein [Caudoviricetes sp.]